MDRYNQNPCKVASSKSIIRKIKSITVEVFTNKTWNKIPPSIKL